MPSFSSTISPGLVISATASKSGKTTACIGLICALRKFGFDIMAAKAGPDYIDRSWLALASNKPVPNIDIWMSDGDVGLNWLNQLLADNNASQKQRLFIIEGAMGLFDGMRQGGYSTAHLACQLGLPVCLLLNIDGMGQSCGALAEGFLEYKPPMLEKCIPFLGIICTHSGSPSHEKLAFKALEPILAHHNLPLFGFLPKKGAPQLPSRHLGLVQAEENEQNFTIFANWFEKNCDIKAILARLKYLFPAFEPECINNHDNDVIIKKNQEKDKANFFCNISNGNAPPNCVKPVIAIAHDAAFSFIYADLPALLRKLGAEIRFFSPLNDEAIPDCNAIYFPGGYPELYAQQLSSNKWLHDQLHEICRLNKPIYAECGGYIFLGKELRLKDKIYPMAGLLPCNFEMTETLQELGYREAKLDTFQEIKVRGHIFHYGRKIGTNSDNLWLLDSEHNKFEGTAHNKIWASWLHLYPAGSISFWRYWLKQTQENVDG